MSEVELIFRVARSDRSAFNSLYDLYATPLYSLAVRILNDHCEAQDVLQEVFVIIWEKSHSFDEGLGKPFSWAAMITRNKALDHLRARQRQRRIFGQTRANIVLAGIKDESQPVENFQFDQSLIMSDAINELPNEQRQPIELAFFYGLIHLEIAAKLGVPPGTIKARIRRGILRLRDNLEKRL